jgi:hypothetical protein
MSESKKVYGWFWRILLAGLFLFLLIRNLEPLKTINEAYSVPWYLLLLVFFISGAVWFTIAFREGRAIRQEKRAKSKLFMYPNRTKTEGNRGIAYLILAIGFLIVGILSVLFESVSVAVGLLVGTLIFLLFSLFHLTKEQKRAQVVRAN